MNALAHPFAWVRLMKRGVPELQKDVHTETLRIEMIKIAMSGIDAYIGSLGETGVEPFGIKPGLVCRIRVPTSAGVQSSARDRLAKDGLPTSHLKTVLREHPLTLEIASLVAARMVWGCQPGDEMAAGASTLPDVHSADHGCLCQHLLSV